MPCGLLYSAVLVAALSGGAWQGALSMAAFAVGGALWLLAGPWLWQLGQSHVNALRARWGTRVAGLMLIGVASWALWMDWSTNPAFGADKSHKRGLLMLFASQQTLVSSEQSLELRNNVLSCV